MNVNELWHAIFLKISEVVICYQNLLQKIWWHWIKTWWKVNDKKLKWKIQWKVNKCWQAIYKKKIPEAASWPKSYSAEGWSLQTQFHKLSKLIVTINHAQYIDETSMKSQWKVDKKNSMKSLCLSTQFNSQS